jgi:hypothetical protein
MRDEIMLTVTRVTDDSTGIWKMGEVEYGIRVGPLLTFIEMYGQKGVDEIKSTLEHLKGQVQDYADRARQGENDG